jgi:hypothetical protein
MTDKTAASRVARHTAKQEAAGMVRVHIWVPKQFRDKLLAYAASLRQLIKHI